LHLLLQHIFVTQSLLELIHHLLVRSLTGLCSLLQVLYMPLQAAHLSSQEATKLLVLQTAQAVPWRHAHQHMIMLTETPHGRHHSQGLLAQSMLDNCLFLAFIKHAHQDYVMRLHKYRHL